MTAIDWQIPPSMLRWLPRLPRNTPVAVLMRHSVRGPLPPGAAGNDVPITDVGVALARALGARLGTGLRSVHSSPLLRCVQTAEALCAGASVERSIHRDRLLGDPGIYVVDDVQAWPNWEQLGHEGVMAHLVGGDEPLPGMAAPDAAARFLVQHMLATAGSEPGYHVFVTHDSLVTATAARLLGQRLGKDAWPWYLEAAFFWRENGALVAAYRDDERRYEPGGDVNNEDMGSDCVGCGGTGQISCSPK
jgi:broad specificity phosphatase PhoE